MSDDLIKWLKTHSFDREATFKEIKDNEYDKQSFVLATDDDLKGLCNGAQGPFIKLKNCRDILKEEAATVQLPAKPEVVTHADSSANGERSGQDTPEYQAILNELANIKQTLLVTPGAVSALSVKFIQARWIDITSKPSADELVNCAGLKIKHNANEFSTFVGMLSDMAGMQHCVKNLRGAVKPTPQTTLASITSASSTSASTSKHLGSKHLDFTHFPEPTQRELVNIGSKVSPKWKDIGSELGLSAHDLQIIDHNTSKSPNSAQEAMRSVIAKWHSSESSPFTWEIFANALLSDAVQENAVVRELHKTLTNK